MKHAQYRSLERQGKKLSVLALTNLRFAIEKRVGMSAWFVKNGTNDTTQKWIVEYKNELWYVVFDPSTRKIVTILDDAHPEIVAKIVKRNSL
jgi:hypothetical protein